MKQDFSRRAIRYTASDKIFLAIDYLVLACFLVIIAYPLLFVVSASFSAGATTMSLSLIPKRFSLAGYAGRVPVCGHLGSGYANSLLYMVLGTVVSLAMTVLMAYPLSRTDFKAGGFIMVLCMITMYFSGGLIPTHLVVRNWA